MPAFPLHGWMPDGYKAMPLPVLAVFSGILSKVAAYGFLRVVLPVYPDASAHFQELMLLISLASILYGSVLAFTTPDARLILGYSSVAQLGFITLGIFSLQDTGAQGALLQAANHGLVVAPAFFILALLAARAGGSEDIREMGGIAFRAPVLATLFLIVALANLAMPGSSNFVGEFLILLGVFNAKIVIAIVAFTGVVLASVYTLRLFIRAMHNRVGPHVELTRDRARRRAGDRASGGGDPRPRALSPAGAEPQRGLGQGLDPRREGAQPMTPKGPHIDWAGLSPLMALLGAATIVLLVGLLRPRAVREVLVPLLAFAGFAAAIGLGIWQYGEQKDLIAGALRLDDLTIVLSFVFCAGGAAAVLLSWRAVAPREAAHGEYFALMLTSAAGMWVLVAAQNLVTVFLGLELLSIPLYVLCATEMRRATSLEAGLKYLIIGSVGSATLLYGLAFIYGATGSTDFAGIADAAGGLTGDSLLLTGIALSVVGLAFKASVAPFHQWTPDVYEGAPTPVTAFMAVATKAAAFGAFLRLFDVALLDASTDWAPALAALATITIVVGNVGALGQSSLKRLMAWSSVAQAGYMLAGVVVATRLGVQATVFYLGVYLMMNLAAFAVIVIRERETGLGDDIASVQGLGAQRPLLAMAMTLAMLGLAGIPATAGFIGKFYLIDAAIDGDYAWLGVVIVIGSMISLAYYLKVIAAMWMAEAPGAGDRVWRRDSRRWPAARPRPTPRASRSRRGSSRCSSAPRRCSSGSCRRRCSTSRSTPGSR